MTRPTLAVADDNVLVREGLLRVLDRLGYDVTITADSAHALLEGVAATPVDMVLTDVRMPPTHTDEGLRAAHSLRHTHPDLPVVVLSQYVSDAYLDDLIDPNASAGFGYLLKDRIADLDEFANALARVRDGGTAIDPLVISTLMRRQRDPLARLTPREHQILARMAEGHSNAAIASQLFITEAAVVKHVGNILLKLDLPPNDAHNRRVMAVVAFLRHGPTST